MRRALCLLSNMNAGGAETFLMKVFRELDRTRYVFDFCINVKERCFYEDEIESLGGKVYRIPSRSEGFFRHNKDLYELIVTNKYDNVFLLTSNAIALYDLKIAKKAGVTHCAVRSTNSLTGNALRQVIHKIFRCFFLKYADEMIAPSDKAAENMFGIRNMGNNRGRYINNGVNVEDYSYNENYRKEIREEFGIKSNQQVIGHIGRFDSQKNHKFVVEVFSEIYNQNPNSILLLVGEGILKDSILKMIQSYGLEKNVIFAGQRSDANKIYSAMDIMVMPSLFEGMPNVVIEAQASGLKCFISNTITRQVNITNNVFFLPLSDRFEWARIIIANCDYKRNSMKEVFVTKKYDIQSVAAEVVNAVFK